MKGDKFEAWEVIVLYNDGRVEQHEQCDEYKLTLYESHRKYLTEEEAKSMAKSFNDGIPLNTGYKTRYEARFWYSGVER